MEINSDSNWVVNVIKSRKVNLPDVVEIVC